jgi:hypothetical protein
MVFRNIVSLASGYANSSIFRLPQLINSTDMSVPTGSGTISDPWVYNSLNTADNSIATGTHDLGTNTYYVVSVQVDTSSENTDVGSITFEHATPLTPIIIGGDPNSSSLTGYLATGIEITTRYTKDAANSAGSDNATFTLGACPVPIGNLLIDEVNTTPYWLINNTLQDDPITWGTISEPVRVETFANLPNSDQNLYFIAQTSGTCFWDITVDSDPNDLGYLYLNGTPDSNLNGVGGASQNRTGSFAVAQNDVIRIRYLKDGILNANNDTLTVNSLYIN